MEEISGFGLQINVIASRTFPAGILITQFADDADPFDMPAVQIADKGMGLNGDLVVWSKAAPLDVTLNVIPDSEDDLNLAALAEANRVSKGKKSAGDVITMTAVYVSGKTVTLTNGKLTNALPASAVASAGRKKSKAYTFTFESKAGT
jgi:hypothetical protein